MFQPSIPVEIYVVVAQHLRPADLVVHRRVCRAWNDYLTSPDLCRALLIQHFPRCRETREALGQAWPLSPSQPPPSSAPPIPPPRDWAAVFTAVVRRYCTFFFGRAGLRPKVTLVPSLPGIYVNGNDAPDRLANGMGRGPWAANPNFVFHGIAPWLQRMSYSDPFFENTLQSWNAPWTFCAELSALVFVADVDASVLPMLRTKDDATPLRIWHLDARTAHRVPFDVRGRIIRRLRLAHGLLAIEWASKKPMPGRFSSSTAPPHPHYATLFEITVSGGVAASSPESSGPAGRATSSNSPTPLVCELRIKMRGTVKIMEAGLPLGYTNRYFTAHTATHYVLYRDKSSLLGHSATASEYRRNLRAAETLQVFDIRPQFMVDVIRPDGRVMTSGQRILSLDLTKLAFHCVTQFHIGLLREIRLDKHNVFFSEEARCERSLDMPSAAEPWMDLQSMHCVRGTAIPVVPFDDAARASSGTGDGDETEDADVDGRPQPAKHTQRVFGPTWAAACKKGSGRGAWGYGADFPHLALPQEHPPACVQRQWVRETLANDIERTTDGHTKRAAAAVVQRLRRDMHQLAGEQDQQHAQDQQHGQDPDHDLPDARTAVDLYRLTVGHTGLARLENRAAMIRYMVYNQHVPPGMADDGVPHTFLPACWRHARFPSIVRAQCVDVAAGVRFSAETAGPSPAYGDFSQESKPYPGANVALNVEVAAGTCDTMLGDVEFDDGMHGCRLDPDLSTRLTHSGRWFVSRGEPGTDGRPARIQYVTQYALEGDERRLIGQDSWGRVVIIEF